MRSILLLAPVAFAALFAATATWAMEPTHRDQIPPDDPEWHVLQVTPDYTLYLEARTMGRIDDTGYAWQGKFFTDGGVPVLMRLVIDCPSSTITYDWAIMYSHAPKLEPIIQQGPNGTSVAGTDEEKKVVDAVCSGRPLAGAPLVGLAAAEKHARTAPLEPDHFALLPANPSYQYVAWQEGVGHIYVEGPTSFRVGDEARVWLAVIGAVPQYEPPLFVHWIVYCDQFQHTPDYQMAMDANFDVVSRGVPEGEPLFEPNDEIAQKIENAACHQPIDAGPVIGSIDDAIVHSALAIADQFMDEEEQLLQEGYPPSFGLDLVEVYRQDQPDRIKLYVDQTYIEVASGSASVWVFYSFFGGLPTGDGSKMAGFWAREKYDCNALVAQQERAYWVGYDSSLRDAGILYPDQRQLHPDSFEGQIRARACFGTPMPAAEGKQHLTSDADAIIDTLAAWQ